MNNNGILLRGTIGKHQVRFFAIDSTKMVKEMRLTHNTSYTATVVLGQLLSAGALMGAALKNDNDVLTITVNGGGSGGNLICSAFKRGLVKVYASNPLAETAQNSDGSLDTKEFVGTNGKITVIKDMGFGQPYTGQSEIEYGKIAQDLALYYLQSEQVPSLIALGVSFDNDGLITKAGGIMLQALPQCDDGIINELELRSMIMSDISKQLEVLSIEEFMRALFYDMDLEISETTYPYYGCDCTEEKIEKVLLSMGENELMDMANTQEMTKISCHFCNKEYSYSKDDILNIIKIGKK